MEISLPVGGELQSIGTTGVITVQSEKFIMFDGNIFSLDTLEWGIKKYLQGKNCGESRENVVLVRPDKSLSVEILIKICEIARKSGYSAVQIASSPFVVR
jgi:biopolymer transport protein ExbD